MSDSNHMLTHNRRRPLTPWELPLLLTPLYHYRRATQKPTRDRAHYPAILSFIYRNRFAVSCQVQRRFPKYLRSDRTTRRHLEEMEHLGYLGLAPTRNTSPLWPKVYYVTPKGLRKLGAVLAAQGKKWHPSRVDRPSRHRREGYSSDRVVHEVLTTEFLLAAWQTIEARPDLELLTTQRRSLGKHPAFAVTMGDRRTRLEPDAFFLFRQKAGGMVGCFVELDTGTMTTKQIREKYRRYEAWKQSEAGQQYLINLYRGQGAAAPRPSFRVLLIADDRKGEGGRQRLIELFTVALDFSGSLRDHFWFACVAELKVHQEEPQPLGSAVWHRGRDARSWAGEYRGLFKGAGKKGDGKKAREFVSKQLNGIPKHLLFPAT